MIRMFRFPVEMKIFVLEIQIKIILEKKLVEFKIKTNRKWAVRLEIVPIKAKTRTRILVQEAGKKTKRKVLQASALQSQLHICWPNRYFAKCLNLFGFFLSIRKGLLLFSATMCTPVTIVPFSNHL